MVSVPSVLDITYCEGARLLQDSQADIDAILVQRPNGNLTCKHCYLVIADGDNLRTISSDKDWPLVVSCHVQACASLHDRRAAYSCYACLERGKTSIETSVAALKTHLQSCDLIKDVQPTKPSQRQETIKEEQAAGPTIPERPKRRSRPAPAMPATPERQPARDAESAQSASSRRPVPSNPFWPGQTASPVVPNSPVTPKQTHSQGTLPAESERPSESRSRREVPTQAERTYTPSNAARSGQPGQPNLNRPHADPADIFNVPGGFPPHEAAGHDPRSPFFQEFPPTPPPRGSFSSNDQATAAIRRKDVRSEAAGAASQPSSDPVREDWSLPTRPTRAPPAPPVLSAPAPGPNSRADVRPHRSDVPPFQNNISGVNGPAMEHGSVHQQSPYADAAKIHQLAALGISRVRAEYLLSQTGGDVNEAAELGFSEQQGSISGGGGVGLGGWMPTAASQAAQPETLPSSPSLDRRNRRSK